MVDSTDDSKPKAGATRRRSKPDDADGYAQFVQQVAAGNEAATRKYLELYKSYAQEIQRLYTDLVTANPAPAFASEILNGMQSQDVGTIVDAYKTLFENSYQTQVTANKRSSEAAELFKRGLQEIAEEAAAEMEDCVEKYSSSVVEGAQDTPVDKMDSTALSTYAQSLAVRANVLHQKELRQA